MRLVHAFSPISPHDFIMPTFSDCFLRPLKGVAQNCGAVGPRFQVSKCTVYHWRPKSSHSSSLAEVAGAGQVQVNGFGLLAIEKNNLTHSAEAEGFQSLLVSFSDIMNQKGRLAWELYLKMGTSSDSFSLLQLIANDCYKVTLFCISGGPCVSCSGLQWRHTWLHIINKPHNTTDTARLGNPYRITLAHYVTLICRWLVKLVMSAPIFR